MNKYILFGTILFIMIFSVYLVSSFDSYDPSGGYSSTDISTSNLEDSGSRKQQTSSGITTFFQLMSFNIEGIPDIIVIFIFYPMTGILLFMLVDIIKDLIPFT